ncbi:MAG: hypothetical protein GF349_02820 [Candidatus Magasanikbacteria bacterium]|nr:hypothetical protein [Candidatus Magasanikbacteria bacterium]
MTNPIHHIHRRKRKYQKLEKYPHPDKVKKFMDKFILIVGVVGPMMALPQIYKIYSLQDATSISIFTFSAYLVFDVVWFTYGILHREKPIILVYTLWMLINATIVFGAVIYS